MRTFVDETAKIKSDLLIVGTTGIDFMKSARTGKPYKTITFSRDNPNLEEIHSFLDNITRYDKVFVYYPKFVTLLSQTVGITDVTQTSEAGAKENQEEINVIFEPEIDKMVEFFERQIRSLLFFRVILETDLSRTAARLISMSAAEERSDELIKEKKSEVRKATTSFINRQLLETFAGMSQWKK